MKEMVLTSPLQEEEMGSVATGTGNKKSLKALKNSMDSMAFLILFSGSFRQQYSYTKLVVTIRQITHLSA